MATARGLARLYGALANGGEIDGTRFLSRRLVDGLTGRRIIELDRTVGVPLAFHLGYHAIPFGQVMPGFGHVGLGGSMGWADPATGLAFGFVHNRLLTPFVALDHAGFVGVAALIRRAVARGRERGSMRSRCSGRRSTRRTPRSDSPASGSAAPSCAG